MDLNKKKGKNSIPPALPKEKNRKKTSGARRYAKRSGESLSPRVIKKFQTTILQHYEKYGRSLPWRTTNGPYCISVSGVMLQQTQVEGVKEKFEHFVSLFPDFFLLPARHFKKCSRHGLDWDITAALLRLKKTAELVVKQWKGKLPTSEKELLALPGIGNYTAAALSVFAFNRPVVLLETNIRAVFIHFFFFDRDEVNDQEIIPLIEKTLDRSHPRQWYNALMDYGARLKKTLPNPGRRSATTPDRAALQAQTGISED